jgi:oxygen-independent coproporphyrinogen-3 oxidase
MHLYIHVPFCARRCSYCDFAIAVRSRTPDAGFVEAIAREWHRRRDHPVVAAAELLDTLYFGGGTPSRLEPESIARLIELVAGDLPLSPGAEVTLEANPDDITPARAVAWCGAGVNRVSLGVQSHDPAVLEWMHRSHRAEQVPDAVAMLREAGIDNISTDLIFALPPEVRRDWGRDLDLTLALGPTHVSLYGLTIEPRTPLARWTERGTAHEATDDRYAAEYLLAHREFSTAGFEHYEVSNAGRPGHRARHNSAYWELRDYLGLGPSAHSFLAGVRSWNEREWVAWQALVAGGRDPMAGSELLDPEQVELERWYLGLRTDRGLALAERQQELVGSWASAGWAVVADGRFRLTAEGWLRLDALVSAAVAS